MLLFTYTNLHNLPLLKINRSGYSSAVASSNLYHAIENTANLYAGKALCIRWYNTQHSHEALRAKNSHQILYGMKKNSYTLVSRVPCIFLAYTLAQRLVHVAYRLGKFVKTSVSNDFISWINRD